MATQTFNFTAPAGLTLTVDVLVASSGSIFATGVTTTEASSLYTFTLADSAGTYRVNVKQAGVVVGVLYTKSTNIVATYNCVTELWMVDQPLTAEQIRSEIDTNSTKLTDIKSLVEDVPTNTEFASGLSGLNDLSTSDVTGLLTTLKSDLSTAHGSGPWTTADVSALATQASVNDLPTNAELATALSAADDAVLAAVATRASQSSVDTIDDYLDTEIGAIKLIADQYGTMVSLDGSVYRFTANAL